ncbi:MAG: Ada metal-binding domain-containing protein [Cyclobacteriaceae bacterium]
MIQQPDINQKEVRVRIKNGSIVLAGNSKLKIYGQLSCSSGKRMKVENRVFFSSETEARQRGFRPCGHCMRGAYLKWKHGTV